MENNLYGGVLKRHIHYINYIKLCSVYFQKMSITRYKIRRVNELRCIIVMLHVIFHLHLIPFSISDGRPPNVGGIYPFCDQVNHFTCGPYHLLQHVHTAICHGKWIDSQSRQEKLQFFHTTHFYYCRTILIPIVDIKLNHIHDSMNSIIYSSKLKLGQEVKIIMPHVNDWACTPRTFAIIPLERGREKARNYAIVAHSFWSVFYANRMEMNA